MLEAGWGSAPAASVGDLASLVPVAVGHGWFELATESALDFLFAAVEQLGRRACSLPLVDAYVAAGLVPTELHEDIATGALRPAVVLLPDGGSPRPLVEGACGTTHLLRLHPTEGLAELVPVLEMSSAPGLAVPAWSRITAVGKAEPLGVPPEDVCEAVAVYQLGLAARALAAAARAHELAVEHARSRRQFGRPIGSFGAVQQRVAAGAIVVRAAGELVHEAVSASLEGSGDRQLAAQLAVQFVGDGVIPVLAGAQHTLGAIGFFEEHEAAWLFRRVHADVLRLRTGWAQRPGVAEVLLEGGRSLPAFSVGPTADAFRSEVRNLLEAHRTAGPTGSDLYDAEGLRAEMAERGLFALGWPSEHGGRDGTVEEQVVLIEEMKYARGPVDRAMSASMLLGHSILRHGSPEQQAAFLPLIRAGNLAFCLGYSEPEVGSDLASLRTGAIRDGDSWVVNGQKAWTTRAHTASHIWLAVRTDPEARPRHAGITIFLVPMDTPGITVQKHVALSGEISCSVFLDDVRVPDAMRVGEVNGGWTVITDALAAERVVMGGVAATLLRDLDDALEILRCGASDFLGPQGSYERGRLAALAAGLQAARVLVRAAVRTSDPREAILLPPMAAVLSGELAEEFGQGMLALLGPAAALSADVEGARAGGAFERALRLAPMFVIGGGTNDIQRGIIARALGLPRE